MSNPTEKQQQATATIRCTQENAHEVRALMGRWTELDTLVRGLHQAGLVDGLRSVQITLTGSEEFVEKGLAGVKAENAPQAAKTAALESGVSHG